MPRSKVNPSTEQPSPTSGTSGKRKVGTGTGVNGSASNYTSHNGNGKAPVEVSPNGKANSAGESLTEIEIELGRVYPPNKLDIEYTWLLEIMDNGNPYHAIAKSNNGEISYQPVKAPLTQHTLKQHIEGKNTLGVYQLNAANEVKWLGWDVDSTDRKIARDYAAKLLSHLEEVPHVVEFSGSKGYHILIFLTEPIPAATAKEIVEAIRDEEGLPATGKSHVECYPKQATLTKSLPYGNLLKIPLGLHPRSHERSIFVDPKNGWESGDPIPPIDVLGTRATPTQIKSLIEPKDPFSRIVKLMANQWKRNSGEHHHLALYLAGYLSTQGWSETDQRKLLSEVMEAAGDTNEPENRLDAIKSTFKKLTKDERIAGYSRLESLIPGPDLKLLTELAAMHAAPSALRDVWSIRSGKGTIADKEQMIFVRIRRDLTENGAPLCTEDDDTLWYCNETHLITDLGTDKGVRLYAKRYGLNQRDHLSQLVTERVRTWVLNEITPSKVYRLSARVGNKLLINLGGPEVYELDGKEIKTVYNGACGTFFRSNKNPSDVIKPNWINPLDVWSALVDDLSFDRSENNQAAEDQQPEMVKACILSIPFPELLVTRPLLLFMGPSGSGKTTAMRRILKLYEGIGEEVIEVADSKPDSLDASMENCRLVVLDNLEKSTAPWLVSLLQTGATGVKRVKRQLYTNKGEITARVNCFFGLTAINLPSHFGDEATFNRLVPFNLSMIVDPKAESNIQRTFEDSLDRIWGDLLLKLNMIVAVLPGTTEVGPISSSRLADYTQFCNRIKDSGAVDGKKLIEGCNALANAQLYALMQISPYVNVLKEWISNSVVELETSKAHTYSELYKLLKDFAGRQRPKLDFPYPSPEAFARHATVLEPNIVKHFKAKVSDKKNPNSHRKGGMVHTVKFQ